ncbi:MAG: aldo/keto reductase [Nitriliruptoraceae bacterium]
METVALGRTGIEVTTVGIGTGGPSRAGQKHGLALDESVALVRRAVDQGVNLIDTSEIYGTEDIVARVLADVPRDDVIISSKVSPRQEGELRTPAQLAEAFEEALRKLGVDHVDIFHLHAVEVGDYDYARDELAPVLLAAKERGAIRAVGITEPFAADSGHATLQRAVRDDLWDVMMVGFNLIHRTARELIFEPGRAKGIGMLGMFAVRRALGNPDRLRAALSDLDEATRAKIPAQLLADGGIEALIERCGATTLPDLAYRFCREEPGLDATLFGTGSREHLDDNLASFAAPALTPAAIAAIDEAFADVPPMTGN